MAEGIALCAGTADGRLSTVLMAGDSLIVLDNCDRVVKSDFLCSMLTQELVQARILGRSERVLLPSCARVMATGNNLILAGDVTRRALLCRMDAQVLARRPGEPRDDSGPGAKGLHLRGRDARA